MADLAAADTSQLLYPLSLFCDKNDRAVQTIRRIADADLSEPYRSLLVHDSDMTSKLGGISPRLYRTAGAALLH